VKAVLGALSEWAATHFSFTVDDYTRALWADESIPHLRKHFRGLFFSGQRLSFPSLFMSRQWQCGLTNPFITCESTFGPYSQWAAAQFFLTAYESTGAAWADESIRDL